MLDRFFGRETRESTKQMNFLGIIVDWANEAETPEESDRRLLMGGEIYPSMKEVFEGLVSLTEHFTLEEQKARAKTE